MYQVADGQKDSDPQRGYRGLDDSGRAGTERTVIHADDPEAAAETSDRKTGGDGDSQTGNPDANDVICDNAANLVKLAAVLKNKTGIRCDVSDLVSEASIKIIQNWNHFDASKGTKRNFLLSIARFAMLDYIRKQYRLSKNETLAEEIEVKQFDPEKNDTLETLCGNLSQDRAELLHHLSDGLTLREIAAKKNIPPTQVWRDWQSTKERIRLNVSPKEKRMSSDVSLEELREYFDSGNDFSNQYRSLLVKMDDLNEQKKELQTRIKALQENLDQLVRNFTCSQKVYPLFDQFAKAPPTVDEGEEETDWKSWKAFSYFPLARAEWELLGVSHDCTIQDLQKRVDKGDIPEKLKEVIFGMFDDFWQCEDYRRATGRMS